MSGVRPGRVVIAAIAVGLLVGCADGDATVASATSPLTAVISTTPATAATTPTGRTPTAATTPTAGTTPETTEQSVPSTASVSAGGADPAPSTAVTAGEPTRIEVPSLGLDVGIGPVMDVVDGVIDPPTMVQAHRVRGITDPDTLPGPQASNTVYLAGHAWDQDEAAFTALNDVQVGAEVVLTTPAGRLTYRILSVDEVSKDRIAEFAPAWQVRPGGLVLLTCSPKDGAWPDNRVIIAEFVG